MSSEKTNKILVDGYGDMIAKVRDMDLVLYNQYGSYQGEYIAILKDEKDVFIYMGYYGSCSGCDWFEAEAEYEYNSKDNEPDYSVGYREALDYVKGLTIIARMPITLWKKLSTKQKEALAKDAAKREYISEESEIINDIVSAKI